MAVHRLESLSRCLIGSLVIFVATVFLFVSPGCKRDIARGSVKGKVTFNGEPLAEGTILFEPTAENSGPVSGADIENGNYKISRKQGAAVGMNVVEITGKLKTGEPKPVPKGVRLTPEMIYEATGLRPLEFESEVTMTIEIVAGRNEFDFPLRSISPK